MTCFLITLNICRIKATEQTYVSKLKNGCPDSNQKPSSIR